MKCFKIYSNKINTRLDPVFVWANTKSQKTSIFPLYKIADLSSSFTGGTPSKLNKDYWMGDIAWVSPKDFIDFYIDDSQDHINQQAINDSSTKLIPQNALLIVFRSGILKHTLPIAISRKPLTINQDIKALVFNKKFKILPEYAGYYLNVFQDEILPLIVKHSTTVQSVNSEQFNQLKIPLPPIEIQNQIVNLMNMSITNKKQKLRQAEELLSSIDEYILSELGIKLPEMKDKTAYVINSKEIDKRIDPYYYQPKFKELYKKIKNYDKILLLKDIVEELDYGLMPTQDYAESEEYGVPMIRVTNILQVGTIDMSDTKYIPFNTPKLNLKRVRENDILMVQCGSTTGKVGFVPKAYENYTFGSFSFVIRGKKEIINQYFLWAMLSNRLVQEQIKHTWNIVTVRPNTSKPNVENLLIPIPSLSIQQKIADEVKSRMDKAKQLQKEAQEALEQARKKAEEMILGNH